MIYTRESSLGCGPLTLSSARCTVPYTVSVSKWYMTWVTMPGAHAQQRLLEWAFSISWLVFARTIWRNLFAFKGSVLCPFTKRVVFVLNMMPLQRSPLSSDRYVFWLGVYLYSTSLLVAHDTIWFFSVFLLLFFPFLLGRALFSVMGTCLFLWSLPLFVIGLLLSLFDQVCDVVFVYFFYLILDLAEQISKLNLD